MDEYRGLANLQFKICSATAVEATTELECRKKKFVFIKSQVLNID